MTKADIIEGVYEDVGFSKKESAEIVAVAGLKGSPQTYPSGD